MVRETGEKHHNRQQMVYDLEMSGYKAGEDFIVMNVPNIVNITAIGKNKRSFLDLFLVQQLLIQISR